MKHPEAERRKLEASRLLAKGSFPAAFKASERLLREKPDDLFGLYAKCYCLTRDGRPQARAEIQELCRKIVSLAEKGYRRTLPVDERNSVQWAYNALAWYAAEEAQGPDDLRAARRLAEIGCGIMYDDTCNGIFDTLLTILMRLGEEQEAGVQIRRKLTAQPKYAPFQKFRELPAYARWLKRRKPPTAAQALEYFDAYARRSPYFPYAGVRFGERLTGEFVERFGRTEFRLPPTFAALAVEKGLPSFPAKPDAGFGSLSCEILHPHLWQPETDDLVGSLDDVETPDGLAVFQYYRFENVSDFFAFNTRNRRKSGELEIGAVFHDDPYSAYGFKSFDEHIAELVERLITEA